MGPQSPNRSNLYSKKVLLVDRCQATRGVRAAVLRRHGIEVHTCENLSGARFLWQPQVYDLILLDRPQTASRRSTRVL
jgi:DNA-binding response OmpR family regulator